MKSEIKSFFDLLQQFFGITISELNFDQADMACWIIAQRFMVYVLPRFSRILSWHQEGIIKMNTGDIDTLVSDPIKLQYFTSEDSGVCLISLVK